MTSCPSPRACKRWASESLGLGPARNGSMAYPIVSVLLVVVVTVVVVVRIGPTNADTDGDKHCQQNGPDLPDGGERS